MEDAISSIINARTPVAGTVRLQYTTVQLYAAPVRGAAQRSIARRRRYKNLRAALYVAAVLFHELCFATSVAASDDTSHNPIWRMTWT